MKFIKDVIRTMKNTTWENAAQTRKDTETVIIVSLGLVCFFAVIDAVIQSLISFI